jgi:oligopeptide transport system substrate-binding protein
MVGMRRRLPLLFVLLLANLAALPGCAPDDRDMSVLRRGNGGDPQTLDPARADDVQSFAVLTDIYEGLVTIDAHGQLIPGVAESWDVDSDGLSYTFHLNPGARWSNGEPVLAQHFVAAFRRTLSPDIGSAYAFLLHAIKNAALVASGELPAEELGVDAPDARTLVIRLDAPAPQLLSILAMPIAYPLWTDAATASEQFSDAQHFVGNGPYLLAAWQPGSRIRLQKNFLYRDAGSVQIDVVEYYAIQDPLSELNMYRAGELDITTTVPGPNVKQLRDTRSGELHIAPSLGIYYLAFDLSEDPLNDLALRQALTMAINRNALVSVIGRGEQPAYGLVPDGVSGYKPARYGWSSLSEIEREAEARRIFASSRYATTTPLRLKLTYDAGDIHEKVAVAVSAMWRDVLGIDVELDKREWKYFLATRDNRKEWQMMRFAWTGDYDHASTFTEILHSASPQNLPGYANPRFDELLDAAVNASDTSTQAQLLAQAEAVMLENYPIAPLYFYVSKHLVSPSVRGFHNNVLDQHPSRFLSLAK